ncbi:MAG: helix-turn-helix domain-containing protein [Solirubrobacterales bacterium]
MAHPEYIRQKAIDLRVEQGLTIDELAECLSLSKTTIYYWVKDIEIPRKPGGGWPSEAQRKGTAAMQEKYRRIREEAYAEGVKMYAELSLEPTFRDFVCMYIGEGYKRRRNEVSLCNSNPSVVKLAQTWMLRFSRNPVKYSIQYHADQSLDGLREFWSERLGIEPDAIKFQRKSNSNQLKGRKWRSQYGVLNVHAADTVFRAQLQAWIDLVEAEWE